MEIQAPVVMKPKRKAAPFVPKSTVDPRYQVTLKQRKWTEEYVKHKNGMKATRIAYPDANEQTAIQISDRNKKNPKIQAYMEVLLDEAGLGNEDIARYMHKIVKAGTSERALQGVKVSDAVRVLENASRIKGLIVEHKQIDKRTVNLELKGNTALEKLAEIQKQMGDFVKMAKERETRALNQAQNNDGIQNT